MDSEARVAPSQVGLNAGRELSGVEGPKLKNPYRDRYETG